MYIRMYVYTCIYCVVDKSIYIMPMCLPHDNTMNTDALAMTLQNTNS